MKMTVALILNLLRSYCDGASLFFFFEEEEYNLHHAGEKKNTISDRKLKT